MGKRAGGGQTAEQWKKGQGRQGRGGLAWAEEMGWVCRKQEDKQEMGGDSLKRQHGKSGVKARMKPRGSTGQHSERPTNPFECPSHHTVCVFEIKMRRWEICSFLTIYTSHKLSVRWKEQEIIVFSRIHFLVNFFLPVFISASNFCFSSLVSFLKCL